MTQRGDFSVTPLTVAHNPALSLGARAMYTILAGYWWRTGECAVPLQELAAMAHRTPRHCRRFLDELVDGGHILRERIGPGERNIYRPSADTGVRSLGTPVSRMADISVLAPRTPVSPVSPGPYIETKENREKGEKPEVSKDLEEIRSVFAHYRERIQPAARICPTDKIRARLKTFSVEELTQGIDNFAADAWWMENNGARGATWYFHSDPRSEQFLNLTPRRSEADVASAPKDYAETRRGRLPANINRPMPERAADYSTGRYGSVAKH